MVNILAKSTGHFKIGKMYQNITINESWPLYAVEVKEDSDEYQSEYSKRRGYLRSGDIFIPLEELQTANYLHVKILAEDGIVYRIAVLNNINYLLKWFDEVTN